METVEIRFIRQREKAGEWMGFALHAVPHGVTQCGVLSRTLVGRQRTSPYAQVASDGLLLRR
jgi:hypothetical protein